jgi:hypothetical protein
MGLIIALFIIAVVGVILVYILSNRKPAGGAAESPAPEFVEKAEEPPPPPAPEKPEEDKPASPGL